MCKPSAASWAALAAEYKQAEQALAAAKEAADIASDCELLTEMLLSTSHARRVIERKALHELGGFSAAELGLLAPQERQVAELRQRYNCKKTAEILGVSASQVHVVHKRAISKLERAHLRLAGGIPPELSRRQEKIYTLYFARKRRAAAIAKELKISIKTVENQIKIIREIVKKSGMAEHWPGGESCPGRYGEI